MSVSAEFAPDFDKIQILFYIQATLPLAGLPEAPRAAQRYFPHHGTLMQWTPVPGRIRDMPCLFTT
jgi:hypothetical protein